MNRILFALLTLASLGAQAQKTTVTDSQINTLNSATTVGTVSIHDPSIVYSPTSKTYYIWGSHLGNGKSTDLKSWTVMHTSFWFDPYFIHLAHQGDATGEACNNREAFNVQQVSKIKNYQGVEVDMPNCDAESYANRYAESGDPKEYYIDGCMWAPDIIYNPTMGKWCMYLSLNGDKWSSVIILLTSNSAEGPWTYQGPIVMGGFNSSSATTTAPKFNETTLGIAIGATSIPSRYTIGNNWGNYWPNCIDPCVFFDEEGELWMIYGSWSGGIFMLKLDKETGMNDYKYNCDNNPSDYSSQGRNGVKDPYFGRKIAGGYYVSGEGPYIKYIDGYYYLFMSYGDFAPRDGYEMRIFRSTSPMGPYKDAAGRSALYTSYVLNYNNQDNETKTFYTMADTRGAKLMGSYTGFGEMQTQGWNSQGHNSVAVNSDKNQAFVVYHTKFNDGTAGHLVRTQMLFQNESGWLVAAPFEYSGETETLDTPKTSHYSTEDIVGDWHVIRHYYKMKQDSLTITKQVPTIITLKDDGKVTGDSYSYTGTWRMTEGTDYITIKLGSYTYQGVICSGSMNGDSKNATWTGNNHKTISFTCMDSSTNSDNSGTPLWGYKLEPKSAIAYNHTKLTLPSTTTTLSGNLNVYTDMEENVVENWTSSDTDILTNTGKFRAPETEPSSTLTVKYTGELTCGDYIWSKSFSWTYSNRTKKIAIGQADGDYLSGLVAYYDFNQTPAVNLKDESQVATVGKASAGGTIPTFNTDSAYRCGMVLHQYFGAQARASYTRMDNPLKGQNIEGATVSLWVKRLDDNVWDAVWSFFSGTSSSDSGERLYLTGNSYLGYNDNDGTWFDINHPNDVTSKNIPVGKWTLVTYVFDETGIKLYINGEYKAHETFSSSAASAEDFDYSKVLDWMSSAEYFYFGLGSFWGSTPAEFDDLLIYNRALTQEDITGLNIMENRDYNFALGHYTPTGIFLLDEEKSVEKHPVDDRIYDLNGRILNAVPRKGIYIQEGKKKIAL